MEKPKKAAKTTQSATAGAATLKRILFADDNKSIRDIVSECLEFIGYEVSLAINGIEALAIFLETSFDLVLTDLEMPVMDGLSLAGRIKEKSPGTPVILLTGADSETVLKMDSGAVDSVILKPFSLEDLQGAVQRTLVSGRFNRTTHRVKPS